MHTVASCLFVRSNSVRKIRPSQTMGDDSPDPTAAFQRTFWPGPKCTGGRPSPTPEEFGPLNWGHHTLPLFSVAPAKLDRTTVTRRVLHEARVMMNSGGDSAPASVYRIYESCVTRMRVLNGFREFIQLLFNLDA